MHFLQDRNIFSNAMAKRGGGPFANAIDRQDSGFLKRRGIKGAGGVRQMMLGKYQRDLYVPDSQLIPDNFLQEEFFTEPYRHRGDKASYARWREGVISLQKPFEF